MNNYKIYAIYDNKAEAFMEPYFAVNAALASRRFQENVQMQDSLFGKYPNDFCLYEIGEFNEQTGHLTNYDENVNLGLAVDFTDKELKAV